MLSAVKVVSASLPFYRGNRQENQWTGETYRARSTAAAGAVASAFAGGAGAIYHAQLAKLHLFLSFFLGGVLDKQDDMMVLAITVLPLCWIQPTSGQTDKACGWEDVPGSHDESDWMGGLEKTVNLVG